MNELHITFDLTLDDLVAFQLSRADTAPTMRRWFWRGLVTTSVMILFSIPLAIAGMPLLFPRFEAWGNWLLIPLVFLAGWVIAWPRTHRRMIAKSARRVLSEVHQKGTLGRHTVRINEQGVTESTEVNDTRHSWAGIEQVEQDGCYVFLLTGPLSGYLIPKAAFSSAEEVQQFMVTAGMYRDNAVMCTAAEPVVGADNPPESRC